eukprot:TRINITY_DN96588_c0_g1_i1.p1 TRINITY_DN96588_c0_g1~~TRINITY_DN96588_c0_g1_i1.p1  ORF type:complete len:232 (-),score=53.79 TRINITY_DN96588_c0_g1_i1:79-738(-)
MLSGFQVDVSHQEVERILNETEIWYHTAKDQVGVDWLPLDGIKNFLLNDLGYEDEDEFEDALHGSFEAFLGAFPHIEVKQDEKGKPVFKLLEQKPSPPRKLTLTLKSSAQLLETTLLMSPQAEFEIPCREFTKGANNKRVIDSLYNHIASMVDELEQHASTLVPDPDDKAKLLEVVENLRTLLDVEEPFDIVIHDLDGLSEFKPMDSVRIEELASSSSK